MKIQKVLLGILISLLIGNNSFAQENDPIIAKAKSIVSAKMKDPLSTQFQSIARYKTGSVDIVCGMYNAKNSYGGYVGFKEFIVMNDVVFVREENNIKEFDDAAKFFCRNPS